jgi:hypothetical protein
VDDHILGIVAQAHKNQGRRAHYHRFLYPTLLHLLHLEALLYFPNPQTDRE